MNSFIVWIHVLYEFFHTRASNLLNKDKILHYDAHHAYVTINYDPKLRQFGVYLEYNLLFFPCHVFTKI